jgi:predicted dinucleotide-binding enzyme
MSVKKRKREVSTMIDCKTAATITAEATAALKAKVENAVLAYLEAEVEPRILEAAEAGRDCIVVTVPSGYAVAAIAKKLTDLGYRVITEQTNGRMISVLW